MENRNCQEKMMSGENYCFISVAVPVIAVIVDSAVEQ